MGHITDAKNLLAGLIKCPQCEQWVEAKYIFWKDDQPECCVFCD